MAGMGERVTAAEPVCPAWCENRDKHDAEARQASGSWFAHSATLMDRALAHVSVCAIQTFPEQLEPGAADGPAEVGVEIRQEWLSADEALDVAAAIITAGTLAAQAPAQTAADSTAVFTWRDLKLGSNLDCCRRYDAERHAIPLEGAELERAVRDRTDVGGLLAWNKTRDEEGGTIIMLTGQSREAERQVLDNAEWLVSCGAVYAMSRVGLRGYKARPDYTALVDGDTYLVWLLPNDGPVGGGR